MLTKRTSSHTGSELTGSMEMEANGREAQRASVPAFKIPFQEIWPDVL